MEATAQNFVKNWLGNNPDRTPDEAWKIWTGLSPETKAFLMNLNRFDDRPVRVTKTC